MGGASTHIGEVKYVQFIPQLAKPLLIKWLGEDIIKLINGAHTLNANVPFLLMISYEIVTDINVLCSCMLNQIVTLQHSYCHSNGTFLNLILKSFKVAFIQRICAQQLPVDMYSASAVDNATLFCFFDDHETSDLPNNLHVPQVLFLSMLLPA